MAGQNRIIDVQTVPGLSKAEGQLRPLRRGYRTSRILSLLGECGHLISPRVNG
jgi:hypothetical protein